MMNKIKYILYALLGITVLIICIFYFGGQVTDANNNSEPVYTSVLLYWMYFLFILSSVVLIAFSIRKFIQIFKENPRTFWRNFIVFSLMVVLLLATWLLGSGKILNIEGYDGNENTYFWLKLSDMFLYSVYVLLALAVLAVIGANFWQIAKKQ